MRHCTSCNNIIIDSNEHVTRKADNKIFCKQNFTITTSHTKMNEDDGSR